MADTSCLFLYDSHKAFLLIKTFHERFFFFHIVWIWAINRSHRPIILTSFPSVLPDLMSRWFQQTSWFFPISFLPRIRAWIKDAERPFIIQFWSMQHRTSYKTCSKSFFQFSLNLSCWNQSTHLHKYLFSNDSNSPFLSVASNPILSYLNDFTYSSSVSQDFEAYREWFSLVPDFHISSITF